MVVAVVSVRVAALAALFVLLSLASSLIKFVILTPPGSSSSTFAASSPSEVLEVKAEFVALEFVALDPHTTHALQLCEFLSEFVPPSVPSAPHALQAC